MITITEAREKYRPANIKLLFIAESPPEDVKRFFYYEDVPEQDSLFIQMMRVIYDLSDSAKVIRANKKSLLDQFCADGFFLEDALDEPIGVKATEAKIRVIKKHRSAFMSKLAQTVDKSVPIILISRPVHDGLRNLLVQKGYDVLNTEMIDFPGSGGQTNFRIKMGKALQLHRTIGESTEDGRVCPQPQAWSELSKLLIQYAHKHTLPKPPVPLILAAWHETSDAMKRQRLKEQMHWSCKYDVIENVYTFLTNLEEKEWFREGE